MKKLVSWSRRKNPVELWLDLLRNAESFEEWEEAALHLDSLMGLDLWYDAKSPSPSVFFPFDRWAAGGTTRRLDTTTGDSSRTG